MTDEGRKPSSELGPELGPEETTFARRIAEVYVPPAPSPQRRVAFRAALDRRLDRERRAFPLSALGGVAAAGIALALVLGAPPEGRPPGPAPATGDRADVETPEAVLLSLATSDAASDEGLPDDYEAIASLFLGEV